MTSSGGNNVIINDKILSEGVVTAGGPTTGKRTTTVEKALGFTCLTYLQRILTAKINTNTKVITKASSKINNTRNQ